MAYTLTKEEFERDCEEAASNGLHVIAGDECTLLVDLDTEKDLDLFKSRVLDMQLHFGIVDWTWHHSKSGVGYHAFVKLEKPADVPSRLLMQLALGSDPIREALCLRRWREHGIENPIRFFSPQLPTWPIVGFDLALEF